MRRRAFIDGTVLIILAAVALAFLVYWAAQVAAPPAAPPAKAAPARVIKPADQHPAKPAATPRNVER
jgi:hypothetical protein